MESPDTLDTPEAVDSGDNEDTGHTAGRLSALDAAATAEATSEKA